MTEGALGRSEVTVTAIQYKAHASSKRLSQYLVDLTTGNFAGGSLDDSVG